MGELIKNLIKFLPLLFILVVGFQNCSQRGAVMLEQSSLFSLSSYSILENSEPKDFELKTLFGARYILPSKFPIKTEHGHILKMDLATLKFSYQPDKGFFGTDTLIFQSKDEETQLVHEKVLIMNVEIINPLPVIESDNFIFDMNSENNVFEIIISDFHDPKPLSRFENSESVEFITPNGKLKSIGSNKYTYTPNKNFRGDEEIMILATNFLSYASKKKIILTVGNVFKNIEPSMAIRATGCISCHLKSESKVVTDFGSGDNYFFGKQAIADGANPFSSGVYSFYNDHKGKSWFTNSISNEILVPKVSLLELGFNLSSYSTFLKTEAQVKSTTLAEYVSAVSNGSSVKEKDEIFIGAPSSEILIERSNIKDKNFVYYKNESKSPDLLGLQEKNGYYEITDLTCDGDLIIKGTLYLKNLTLFTDTGCRIYTTGAIFINGAIQYKNIIDSKNTEKTNLQLVSSSWINFGVGLTHCETENNPGWHVNNHTIDPETGKDSPVYHRMIRYSTFTRGAPSVKQAKEKNLQLKKELTSIIGFEDASCHALGSNKPREIHYERLLVNAPRIDSRYKGQFSGVIIAEVPLMSLSAFSFKYDEVFNKVPILPILKQSDYFVVK